MSATISENKLKFSVFGRGFEDERSDSGEGADTKVDSIGMYSYSAIIDTSNTYVWIQGGDDSSVRKYDLSTLEEVAQTALPDTSSNMSRPKLFHPNNTDNNYGIEFVYHNDTGFTEITVFDMTDDTVHHNASISGAILPDENCECIVVGNMVHICERKYVRSDPICYHLNLDTMTVSSDQGGGIVPCGFINDNTIYTYYPPQWFSDYKVLYGMDLTWNTVWSRTAGSSGSSGFPNINQRGFCGNGFIYLPTYKNNAWRYGVYKDYSDFTTPKPKKMFGKFSSEPVITSPPMYSNEKKRICFLTASGLYVTDTNDIETVTTEQIKPVAMNDYCIVATEGNTTKFFWYR